ncbi:hypothetical protein EJ04DRAFT_508354 [Polyplosphaeria fusca]|uniref:Pentatricopeptide repeat protein n=1 Tax=Polyplosphaeria fusca TaxID=682080 RepID=A0A9P4V4T6_9PLEO|nr:hypothetical protein EJ04DRAFT_508354 [Polyplosphaeria fusca]
MQTLWSRAARIPGTCKCFSCLSNTTSALARRTRPTAVKGAWAFGTPTSTFVYTVIFAAGLAIDGGAKRNRTKQWDDAFAALNEEMAKAAQRRKENMARSAGKEATVDNITPADEVILDSDNSQLVHDSCTNCDPIQRVEAQLNRLDWDKIQRAVGTELVVSPRVDIPPETFVPAYQVEDDLCRLLQYDSRFPSTQKLEWSANTGRALDRSKLPPQSLWSLDQARDRALRKRLSWKKLAYQEVAIALLVHRLLHRAFFTPMGKHHYIPNDVFNLLSTPVKTILSLSVIAFEQIEQQLLDYFRSIMNTYGTASGEEIARLKMESRDIRTVIPKYHQDDDGDFYATTAEMNAAIKHVVSQHKERPNALEISLIVAKVCHNLLVSSAPPDVQTFNILITAFGGWDLRWFTHTVVVASFRCHIRPNEITCAAILNHYIKTRDPNGFVKYIEKMRGMKRKAVMLAHPRTKMPEEFLVREKERKVILKVHSSPLVFKVLMYGVLKFAGFERAMDVYSDMKTEGWGLDVLGLEKFLTNCVYRADWEGGQLIWLEICSIATRSKKAHVERAFATMLSLCSVCGKKKASDQLVRETEERKLLTLRILEYATQTTRVAKHMTEKQRQLNGLAGYAAEDVLDAFAGYRTDFFDPSVLEVVESEMQGDNPLEVD